MKKLWENNAVIAINLAMYVAPGKGKSHHSRRRYHGLVYNEENSRRDYFFSDGFVLKTGPRDLYYLPKSASYQVKSEGSGGCYAINFDLLSDPELPLFPFP